MMAEMNTPTHLLCNQMGHGNIHVTQQYYIAMSKNGMDIVAAGFLQLLVLFRSEEGGGFGEGVAQFDGAVLGIQRDSVHFSFLSGFMRFSFRSSLFRLRGLFCSLHLTYIV